MHAFVHLATNIYMYMTIMLYSTLYQTNMERMWKKNLGLTVRDKVALRKGKLCDRHMHAANKLLAAQFPHLQGLQSTLLSQTSFTSIQESGGYISEGKCFIVLICAVNVF